MSLDDLSTNTLEAASGSLVPQYAGNATPSGVGFVLSAFSGRSVTKIDLQRVAPTGFWQVDQPDAKKGQCVRAFTANADQSWALSSCESLLPFVCRSKACPKRK